jgi:protein-S-isoprenylcysteine O-methyltransferase Ste14
MNPRYIVETNEIARNPSSLMKSATLKDASWVMVQLALMAALLVAPAVGHLPLLVSLRMPGLLVSAVGLALAGVATLQLHLGRSLTPMPTPRAGATLLTSGLYRGVRHPVYSGLLLWAFGVATAAASLLHLLFFGLLWAFLTAKAAHEERLLRQIFSNYDEYAARTPRFLPLPYRSPRP